MDDRRAVTLWSSGVLAAALSVVLLLASRLHGPLWHDPWFALSVTVSVAVFAILVASGIPDLRGWLRTRGRPAPSAIITSPLTGQVVPQAMWARGSAANITNGMSLWLVILATFASVHVIRAPTAE